MSGDTLRPWQQTRDCNYHMRTVDFISLISFSFLLGQHCYSSPFLFFISHNGCLSTVAVQIAWLQKHSLKWILLRTCQSSSTLQSISLFVYPASYFFKLLPISRKTGHGQRRWGSRQGWHSPNYCLTYTMRQTRPEKQPCLKIHG